ncbi:hypothetical protein [Flavivirga sp. 57AJ16]|uniref:hypothetical protein n=1 Tax=Flavivirga sp. 57AJ16 TaxID=3025307 RepID=UPI00236700A2|nr:hypothetical protein [Flavivirga sp. 57AJ16]MDD7885479.1 hypothetical protein [Flavivirga sp. 57AJ16]
MRKVFIQSLILALLFSGCSSDNNTPINPDEEINLQEAKLSNFPFEEIDYVGIQITQPILDNNEELYEGVIIITLPHTITSLALTLKSVNIDTSKFNIFPSVGSQENFSEIDYMRYEITSNTNPEMSIHYNVRVIIAPNPDEEKLSISSFELLANDNSSSTNINLIKEAKSTQIADSLLVCLFPTTIDFSDIKPVIEYIGSKIEYRINGENFSEYPIETGRSIDFEYPNTVDFKISNSTNSKSIVYRIIVDTQNPIFFNQEEVVIPDLQMGNTYNGIGIGSWTNKGNYPISTMGPNEYTNVTTPVAGLNNIFVATLSKDTGGNINPGEDGTINVVVTNTPIEGEYEATAVFHLNFNENSWEIVSSPIDDYVNNIGYNNAELNISGRITN